MPSSNDFLEIGHKGGERVSEVPPRSIVEAAANDGDEWEEIVSTCNSLYDGSVKILGVVGPVETEKTGHVARAIKAEIYREHVGKVSVNFVLGVQGDDIFTGYTSPAVQDEYTLTLDDGRRYSDRVYWPLDEEREPHMMRAWDGFAGVRASITYTILARLLSDRPIVDDL